MTNNIKNIRKFTPDITYETGLHIKPDAENIKLLILIQATYLQDVFDTDNTKNYPFAFPYSLLSMVVPRLKTKEIATTWFEIVDEVRTPGFEDSMGNALIKFCEVHNIDLKHYLQASTPKLMKSFVAANWEDIQKGGSFQ